MCAAATAEGSRAGMAAAAALATLQEGKALLPGLTVPLL